jgi:hypothetical protein
VRTTTAFALVACSALAACASATPLRPLRPLDAARTGELRAVFDAESNKERFIVALSPT